MTEQNPQENGASGNGDTGPQQQNNGAQTMSLDDATIERIAAASSRQAAQNHGQGPSQQHMQPADNGASSNNQGSNQSDVLTAIQALPEQITRSIKEAFQPPTNSQGNQQGNGAQSNGSGQQQQQGSNEGSQQGSEPGKKRGFAEWWFGK